MAAPRVVVDHGLPVPMRDGVRLTADLYRPDIAGRLPLLLQRTPYGRQVVSSVNIACDVQRAARAGYAVMIQDVRGRFDSGGAFTPFEQEVADGADTIAWIAAQPWSDGMVGMVGASYVGATQWLAAQAAPSGLRAIAPLVTAADYHDGWIYQGGAFCLGLSLCWALESLLPDTAARREGRRALPEAAAAVIDAIDEHYLGHPRSLPALVAELAPYYGDWLAHPGAGGGWRRLAPKAHHERIGVPALNVAGWYDCFLGGTLANYIGMRSRGPGAARASRLVVGPWSHAVMTGRFAERGFGASASADLVDLTGLQLRWFDYWLRQGTRVERDRFEREAPVRIFVMGANHWRDEPDWPLPDTRYTDLFLHSGGAANGAGGDGALAAEPPGDEPADTFRYDPKDPVPTVGGQTLLPGGLLAANAGPRDQRVVEARADVLCYSTPPLRRPLEVTGPVRAVLHVASSAVDTDVTAKLVDVHPDGRAEILTDGIRRARYRDSLDHAVPLTPGEPAAVEVDLWATSNVFLPGHRIRLEVSSSNFPRFDANPNTGFEPGADGGPPPEPVVANNRVLHDRAHPSRLVLPVIERDPAAGAAW
jgi:putative CocE/NonD family hydrolase